MLTLQLAFAAYCWGKPPEKLEVDELEPKTRLVLHFAHEFDEIEDMNRAEALRLKGLPPSDDGAGR